MVEKSIELAVKVPAETKLRHLGRARAPGRDRVSREVG